MNQAEYLDFHRALLEEATKVTAAKNTDYSGEGSDAFKNFRGAASVGVPAAVGAFIRLTDKVARMARLLQAPAAVTTESFRDTVVDLVNYAVIVAALHEERVTREGAEGYLHRVLGQKAGICPGCGKELALGAIHACQAVPTPANPVTTSGRWCPTCNNYLYTDFPHQCQDTAKLASQKSYCALCGQHVDMDHHNCSLIGGV